MQIYTKCYIKYTVHTHICNHSMEMWNATIAHWTCTHMSFATHVAHLTHGIYFCLFLHAAPEILNYEPISTATDMWWETLIRLLWPGLHREICVLQPRLDFCLYERHNALTTVSACLHVVYESSPLDMRTTYRFRFVPHPWFPQSLRMGGDIVTVVYQLTLLWIMLWIMFHNRNARSRTCRILRNGSTAHSAQQCFINIAYDAPLLYIGWWPVTWAKHVTWQHWENVSLCMAISQPFFNSRFEDWIQNACVNRVYDINK